MEYLPPVINHVYNKLNTHLTLKLNYVRYSIPARDTTKLDFDMMSRASGPERADLYNAIREGYIVVDVLMLKNGVYEKVGTYEAAKEITRVYTRTVAKEAPKASEMAEKMGITVKDVEVKKESVNKVEDVETKALDPIKAINNPKVRKATDTKAKKEEAKTVLDTVKEHTKEGE